jgi:hypothetical protein
MACTALAWLLFVTGMIARLFFLSSDGVVEAAVVRAPAACEDASQPAPSLAVLSPGLTNVGSSSNASDATLIVTPLPTLVAASTVPTATPNSSFPSNNSFLPAGYDASGSNDDEACSRGKGDNDFGISAAPTPSASVLALTEHEPTVAPGSESPTMIPFIVGGSMGALLFVIAAATALSSRKAAQNGSQKSNSDSAADGIDEVENRADNTSNVNTESFESSTALSVISDTECYHSIPLVEESVVAGRDHASSVTRNDTDRFHSCLSEAPE